MTEMRVLDRLQFLFGLTPPATLLGDRDRAAHLCTRHVLYSDMVCTGVSCWLLEETKTESRCAGLMNGRDQPSECGTEVLGQRTPK